MPEMLLHVIQHVVPTQRCAWSIDRPRGIQRNWGIEPYAFPSYGGSVASWLTLDRAIRLLALAKDIVLYSWASETLNSHSASLHHACIAIDLHPIHEGVLFLVTSFDRNRDKLQSDGPLGFLMYADFALPYLPFLLGQARHFTCNRQAVANCPATQLTKCLLYRSYCQWHLCWARRFSYLTCFEYCDNFFTSVEEKRKNTSATLRLGFIIYIFNK